MTDDGQKNEDADKLSKKRQETEILKPINFEMTDTDLEQIAEAKSQVVPNLPELGKTAYTIENAPVAKSIQRDYMMEIEPNFAAEQQQESAPEDGDDSSEPEKP